MHPGERPPGVSEADRGLRRMCHVTTQCPEQTKNLCGERFLEQFPLYCRNYEIYFSDVLKVDTKLILISFDLIFSSTPDNKYVQLST